MGGGIATMPIKDFDDHTFVGYTDICGFRQLMKHENRAAIALDHFYKAGYRILANQNAVARRPVEGLFLSDCAVLFCTQTVNRIEALHSLLSVVQLLNREMLDRECMLTTSVAYGEFSYHERLEFPGIDKSPVYGYAYVHAFLDNESGKPKLGPGQVRILKRGLPQRVREALLTRERPFRCVEPRAEHFYYYWMVTSPDQIDSFKRHYSRFFPYKREYSRMLEALRGAVDRGAAAPT